MGGRGMSFGILTSGGDCPGLNAAIQGVAKAALDMGASRVVGIAEGYRGLIDGVSRELGAEDLSGLLTLGGTILGSSREKPFEVRAREKPAEARGGQYASDDEEAIDKPELIKENYRRLGLDCLVVLGGNGTQTTASRLQEEGLEVIGLPKTIDNDLWGTEVSFGFHSAVQVATEAIDRLHSTASSHNRVMVIELMGHKAGWLALSAGIAGGGDVIVIPELPYEAEAIARHLKRRQKQGKSFSIVVVAEGAMSVEEARMDKKDRKKARAEMPWPSIGYRVADELAGLTGMETRVTVLGYLQRGGVPSPYDRLLATSFGAAAAELMRKRDFGRMVAMRSGQVSSVSLAEVAGKTRRIPEGHELILTARRVGTCMGD